MPSARLRLGLEEPRLGLTAELRVRSIPCGARLPRARLPQPFGRRPPRARVARRRKQYGAAEAIWEKILDPRRLVPSMNVCGSRHCPE